MMLLSVRSVGGHNVTKLVFQVFETAEEIMWAENKMGYTVLLMLLLPLNTGFVWLRTVQQETTMAILINTTLGINAVHGRKPG